MNINIINNSYVWDNRQSLIPATTLVLPLAFQVISSLWKIYDQPDCLKQNVVQIKDDIGCFFERNRDYRELLKTVARLAPYVLGLTAVAVFVPTAYVIPAAIAAIKLTYLLIDTLPSNFYKAKLYLQDAFQQRTNEKLEDYNKRRNEAIFYILRCSCVALGAIALATAGIFLSSANSVWDISTKLPFQTPAVVFLEYATIGLLHAFKAVDSLKKKDYGHAIFHMISAAASIAFPIGYMLDGKEVRLHHSFIGLALQLAPWDTVKLFGSVITCDSLLNLLASSPRGYATQFGFVQYDYQNALVDQFSLALTTLVSVCAIEELLNVSLDDGEAATH